MITVPIEQWKKELIFTGKIIQDEDHSVSSAEAHQRCLRYTQLIDMVDGTEDAVVFKAIIASIQVKDDYEVYEATHNALWKFSPEKFAQYFVPLLANFIQRMAKYDQVGRFLCPLIGWAEQDYLPLFNREIGKLFIKDQEIVMDFIHLNEKEGWFEGGVGKIHPL